MANTTRTPQAAPRPGPSKIVRITAMVLLALIILITLVVIIIWLTVKPKRPIYTIEDGLIHGYNLTNNQLKANFDFVLRAYNPNTKVSIYYDKMEVSVYYDDQMLASDPFNPFFQPHRNVTRLGLKLVAKDVSLFKSAAKDLSLEKSSGEVELEVKVKARIRFKVKAWRSRRRTMRVSCKPVLVHFSSSKGFKRSFCDVDL